MNANLAALLYLVAGVLFILALRGLSSPATSRQGNRFGMIGMAIAVLTTLALRPPSRLLLLVPGHPRLRDRRRDRRLARAHRADDGDAATGRDVPFAGRPRRGAGRGGRALCAAWPSASPRAMRIHPASTIEMSLGLAIGAVTFTGSIIAFLKLDGRMSGAPILLPQPPSRSTSPSASRCCRADRRCSTPRSPRSASG